jgi:lipoprotein-anchoring transpeptidase ErfK/SrfK
VSRKAPLALFLLACAGAGLLSAAVVAGPSVAGVGTSGTTGTTGSTDTTTTAPPPTTTTAPTTTQPTPPPPPRPPPPPPRPRPSTTIPIGVSIGGVLVGGLTPAQAREEVQTVFRRPLTILVNKRIFKVTPQQLGSAAYVGNALKQARRARAGRNIPLKVRVSRAKVERWLRTLAERWNQAPVDSRLLLRGAAPFATKEADGRRLKIVVGRKAMVVALTTHDRTPVRLRFDALKPKVTRSSIGDVVVIRRGSNRLALYDGMKLVRTFGVATGQAEYPTPIGSFHIVVKWENPWWYPPASDWAADAEPIPPGPGNPLGTRWMGISSPAVGIHGTPDAASIGYSASHGCIRMRIPDAEWLFERVDIGTPVFIVAS